MNTCESFCLDYNEKYNKSKNTENDMEADI